MASIALIREELVGTYIGYGLNAVYVYESLITFSQEIDVIWSRKWTLMTWLYALPRYTVLINCIWLSFPVWVPEECEPGVYISDVIALTQLLCFALFSALRVYALLDGKLLLAGIVLCLNLTPFVTNLYIVATDEILNEAGHCGPRTTLTVDLLLLLPLITRIAVVIGDFIVLAVTWMKTAQLYREARRLKLKTPLAMTLYRDGTFYFIILLALNILQVIESNIPVLLATGISSLFLEYMTPIITCRFILNLRQVKPAGDSFILGQGKSFSLRFVDNMGQSLQFGGDEEDQAINALFSQDGNSVISIASQEVEGRAGGNTHEVVDVQPLRTTAD